ncbi:MAG TPA: acetate--CoA ligase family protein [Candidatus Bathyarchaeia archaeon]|nr:acetate--CoA ligase family protein [Candidatus Bathyarchaeia archaeon]
MRHTRREVDLAPLLRPRSVAVVGASDRPSPGRMIIESLDCFGFPGPVYPINPNRETLFGRRCYRSIDELPEPVDVLAVGVNHTRVIEQMQAAARRGVRAAIIFDGGFAERGEEGRRRQEELTAICREAGIALCGPNCMGVVTPHARSSIYIQTLRDPARLAGNVGLVSQSGSIVISLLADCRRFGWSHVISSGNEAVLTAVDFLDYLIDDPATRIIALFLESVREPDRFVAALDRAADRGKPVVVLKVGRSERARRAITSHTGGLAGEARVFSAVLRAHRAIEVNELDEMVEVLACCQGPRWPGGRRTAVMTASGGLAELLLDLGAAAGVDLPPLTPDARIEMQKAIGVLSGDGNPLDAWGNGDYATNFPRAVALLGADPTFDVVTFCSDSFDDQPYGTPERLMAYARILADGAAASSKPFYYLTTRPGIFRMDVFEFLRERGIPLIGGTRQGLGAIDRMAGWARPPALLRAGAAEGTARIATVLGARTRPTIHEHDAKRLLAEAGLPIVRERLVADLAEARAAAAALGYPIVLKVVSDTIPHRSEHGLVAVGLHDEKELVVEWERMSTRLAEMGHRDATGFLIQAMERGGLEVFAGVSADPDWGPALAFGTGGVLIETLADVALRTLPLREGDAEAMIAETRAGTLLAGYRGRPPGDVPALVRGLNALADFAWAERDHIAEIDVNPIVVRERGQGCVVVDALIVPRRAPGCAGP